MKLFVLACAATLAVAAPVYEVAPGEVPAILVDERQMAEDGSHYTFQMETEDGIHRQESGTVIQDDNDEGGMAQSGSYSFTLPDGQLFEMSFVADQNGFQPESSFLPVAPEFPHEIPQFVLDQIEKARQEDADEARRPSASSSPSQGYGAP